MEVHLYFYLKNDKFLNLKYIKIEIVEMCDGLTLTERVQHPEKNKNLLMQNDVERHLKKHVQIDCQHQIGNCFNSTVIMNYEK